MITNIPEISTLTFVDPFLLTDPLHIPMLNKALPFAVCTSATDEDLPRLMSAIINFRALSRPEFQLRTQDAVLSATAVPFDKPADIWEHISFGEQPTVQRRGKHWEVALPCTVHGRQLAITLLDGNREPLAVC
ncbi:hypothetical protein J5O04_01160 [Corynebacterium hindlerae]|uniref:hypothetical protein n=1 Tax=Corynebacterium hindlerae TaxID=699041 RepID=UPI001AD775AC|nr:hypothetical protein [Corynebacterium hindlerae]QTH59785.1 hypothetical protein J5O04_01160 [Corynebacterium hindlerae]